MQQLLDVWGRLDLRRKLIVIGATVTMFFAIVAMSRMANAPSMTLLYAGLESGAAGDVVRSLEQRGVIFDVRGGSIFVDSSQRDELRLTLASEGLPANSNKGYELLDSLTGFGTTSQMFDAAYWRAKEGELARTLVSANHITAARVHIANAGSNPFQRNTNPKASVSITTSGASATSAQAKAVRFLVASAVSGLEPEDVAVIDSTGALIGQTEDMQPAIQGDDKAQVLRDRVQRILEARVGFGNAFVEVSVDTETDSEAILERTFDPQSRVAISTDTEESSTSSSDGSGGDVTVASNLPDREGAAGTDSSSSQNSETRERINYEVSQTEREIVRVAGAIKRVTVAVLVNEASIPDGNGTITSAPRSEEELQSLRELVSSAVGYDETRGDIITIKSMALQSISPAGAAAGTSFLDGINLDLMSILQMAMLALVTLILGLFVVRPVLVRPSAASTISLPPAVPMANQETEQPALTGDIADDDLGLPDFGAGSTSFDPNFGDLAELPMRGGKAEDPVERLRNMIGERQEETVEILRGWLEDKEENV